MKIIVNKYLPFKGFIAINLFGVLFVREEYKDKLSSRVLNHEEIHTKQMREMLYVFFYVWYVVEFLVKLCIYRDTGIAYDEVSFEREANMFEHFPDLRRPFGWTDYI